MNSILSLKYHTAILLFVASALEGLNSSAVLLEEINKPILTIGTTKALTLKSGTLFSVDGLVITPSEKLNIINNTLFKTNTPSPELTQSIHFTYQWQSLIESFMGTLRASYLDSELNSSISESDLQLYAYNGVQWIKGTLSDRNSETNQVAASFNQALKSISIASTISGDSSDGSDSSGSGGDSGSGSGSDGSGSDGDSGSGTDPDTGTGGSDGTGGSSGSATDIDGDGIPNELDVDDDGDGVVDTLDTFPRDASEVLDTDGDGIGNNSDTDDDNDGYSDVDELSCGSNPLVSYSIPSDIDRDGIADCIDMDIDGDGCLNTEDVFPTNPLECSDFDSDGVGDNFDVDDDNDGHLDVEDAFPFNDIEWLDSDKDGIGDNADLDNNNDGYDDYTLYPSGLISPYTNTLESTWKIINIEKYPYAKVSVYNKYGMEVFSQQNYQNNWKGVSKDSDKLLPSGSYYYIIDKNDGTRNLDGWFYLVY